VSVERRWWTLIVVCLAIFMLLLDITIVNVALPDIARELHATFSDLQWVVDAYALTLAALLLTAGSLADRLGRRRIFAVGVVLFTASSLACALAPTSTFLILARGAQGIGGAVMFSVSLALLAQEFHGRDRATAFGIWGATTGAAVAVGPLVGGALTSGIGWPAIFYLNLPIGAVALWITLTRVRETRDPGARGIDWAGTVLFSGALFALVLGLIRGNAEGWGSPLIVALLAGAGILLLAFVAVEATQRQPMFDLALFRKPAFCGASLAAFALSAAMFSMFLYLTIYLQTILGYGPFEAGLRLLPISLLSFAVAAASGRMTAYVPARALLGVGLLLTGAGLLLMSGLTATSGWTELLPGFIFAGAGIGLTNPALASTAIGVVAPQRSGMASGINTTFRQVGLATGIAVWGAVFESQLTARLGHELPAALSARAGELATAVSAGAAPQIVGGAPLADRAVLRGAIDTAFTGGLNHIFVLASVVALAGAAGAAILVRGRDFVAPPEAASEPAAA